MAPEYLLTKTVQTLVKDSLDLAQRIDDTNASRIMDLALTKPMRLAETYIRSGLALKLRMSDMKFACQFLGKCMYETTQPRNERANFRRENCHNKSNYQNCIAYK